MKKTAALFLTILMAFAMMACTVSPTETATSAAPAATEPEAETAIAAPEGELYKVLEGKKIGNTICYKGDEWCADLTNKMEAYANQYGVVTTVEDGDLNVETQNKQVENMIANKVDAIFIDPNTPTGINEALKKAQEAGIPIFAYDGYLEGLEAETTITWDQPMTGELMANYVIDYVNKNLNGQAKVVLLTLAASPQCVTRGERFVEVCAEKAPGINIFNTQDCEGNREKAANAITNIVEPFDLVVSVVDNGAWGAISAIEARGLTNVKVFSMGAFGAEPFNALKAGHPNYQACVVVAPEEISKLLYESAAKYFNGETLEKTSNITLYVADSTNVDQFWTFD